MASYSDKRREAVFAKLSPLRNLPVHQVRQQERISELTVSKWRTDAREKRQCVPNIDDGGTVAWSPKHKYASGIKNHSNEWRRVGLVLPSRCASWLTERVTTSPMLVRTSHAAESMCPHADPLGATVAGCQYPRAASRRPACSRPQPGCQPQFGPEPGWIPLRMPKNQLF